MSDKTAAELEREAEAARAKVAGTAESIRSRMTPGQLIDEFTGAFSGGDGGQALNNLKSQVRDNPLPIALVGAGLAWLMLGSGNSGHTARDGSREDARFSTRSDIPSSATGSAPQSGMSLGQGARNLAESGSDALHGAADSIGSMMSDAVESVRSTVADAADQVSDAAAGVTRPVANAGKSAQNLIAQEPLVLGAIGFAIGAAIGALLPTTDVEEEILGGYRDQAQAKASDLLDKGVSAAKEIAAETYDTLKSEADEQGFSRASGKSLAGQVGEVVKNTLSKAEESVRDRVKDIG